MDLIVLSDVAALVGFVLLEGKNLRKGWTCSQKCTWSLHEHVIGEVLTWGPEWLAVTLVIYNASQRSHRISDIGDYLTQVLKSFLTTYLKEPSSLLFCLTAHFFLYHTGSDLYNVFITVYFFNVFSPTARWNCYKDMNYACFVHLSRVIAYVLIGP